MQAEHIETPRLLLRKLNNDDLLDFFALESNPTVQQYVNALSGKSITTPEQAQKILGEIITQYQSYGTGRLVVQEKTSGQFIGLAGVKWHEECINNHSAFYELGYRLLPQYWGKGYASEAAEAAYNHCVNLFQPLKVYAFVHPDNHGSRNVLQKLDFKYREDFMFHEAPMQWYERTTIL